MDLNTDHVKTCTHFGHIYSSVIVQRCPHRESVRVHAQAWQDDDAGDPILLFTVAEEFGPFDSHSFIIEAVGHMASQACSIALSADVHPNASLNM